MSEDFKIQYEQKNTVATVGMRFSIIGLIAVILSSIIGKILIGYVDSTNLVENYNVIYFLWGDVLVWLCGFSCFFIGFILGIIGLFFKPRKKARIAILIPIISFIIYTIIICTYFYNSVKAPAKEFINRAETQVEQLKTDENFDEETFGDLVENEINYIIKEQTEDNWESLYESSTGSNAVEKGSYLIFSIIQQGFENALEKYNNGELPEISDDEDDEIVNIDIDDEEDDEDIDEYNEKDSEKIENTKKENVEVFTQSEKNEIEQILNIIE